MEVFEPLSQTVRTVERALDILLCFSRQTPELTMTQIAELVGINKSTVHRILGTLEERRFVERDLTTGAYKPSINLLQIAYLAIEYNDVRRRAGPFMRRLVEQYRETITLGELDGSEILYLDVIESPQRVKLAAAIGQRLPAFCTASGKAILAFAPDELVQRILESTLPQYTPNTLHSPEALLADLHQIHEQGYAISLQEFEEGINAVAAPILGLNNRPIASVAVAGPSYRLTREQMVEIGSDIQVVAYDIASEIQGTL
jgi:DNA-binding IclR family transcriptional regulator